VQLTKAFQDGSVWRYQFVAGIVYADSPESDVDVNIEIYDQDNKLLCLSKQATVNSSSNHIIIDNCNSSKKASLVKIYVYAKLATQPAFAKDPTSKYLFPIENL
jgi:hypothetical protein